jgi:hypothetical protein
VVGASVAGAPQAASASDAMIMALKRTSKFFFILFFSLGIVEIRKWYYFSGLYVCGV